MKVVFPAPTAITEQRMIIALYETKYPLSGGELSVISGVSYSSGGQFISRLKKTGFIHVSDEIYTSTGRRKILSLTEKGIAAAEILTSGNYEIKKGLFLANDK